MSQKHYIKKWDLTQKDLNRIVRIERPKKPVPADKEKKSAFGNISLRYIKYVRIYQRLEKCYDYMVHPQKRILIGKLLEGVTGRVVELREELIRLDICEYSFMGEVCQDLKLTLPDVEMRLSKYMALDKVVKVRKRMQMLDYILASMNLDDDQEETEDVYTVQEAVLLIQRNERCYQARRRWKKVKLRRKGKRKSVKDFTPLDQVSVNAVIKFQSMWRGHADRKQIHSMRQKMDISLGMLMPPPTMNIKVTEAKVTSDRFKEAQANDDDYKTNIIMSTEEMQEKKAAAMAEEMKTSIYQWILECRNITGEFPVYPEEADGGSAALFSHKTVKELAEDMDDLQVELEKNIKKKPPAKSKKDNKKKNQKKKPPPEGFLMRPSNFIDTTLVDCANEYGTYWWNKDESENRRQTYDKNLMLEDVRANVETVVRAQVDEVMRQELDRLRYAVDQQVAGKPKKPKEKKKKKDKKKKKKKKKMKDLTPGVPIEELFKELVLEGIIKKVPNTPLSDFLGSYNLISDTDAETIECLPDLADIRKMVFDFGILPMSSSSVHLLAPFYKSLILVGPHGSGKRMLVDALCYELGATFFDLSPDNLQDKYEGKQGQQMLMHLVMKVGKEMEPSVIFIGNCDQMFTKALPPEVAELKPARMKKDLTKAMKFIGPEDRILLVGTSKYPFKASMAPMMKLYQRLIFIFPPTHSSRYQLWERLIKAYRGVLDDKFDLSSLTKVSQGFTAGDILNAVREVLTEKRLRRQALHPLRSTEFLNRIATFDPVFISELEEFRLWLVKTPLAKKRSGLLAMEGEGQDIIGLL
ncbi:dynein regulatory complex protein 11 [Aplysia californica]|uniref:Dynein regulatory complex protein 11 n=1 Tax=Aplysia californica TaxID=6500 RepID=A0ABM0ZV73_APLCA|nr:dynein regulatory complex protein 11 [Aplysia californica]